MPTKLCTHTDDVGLINKRELEKCDGEERRYSATDSDPGLARFLNSHTPVEQVTISAPVRIGFLPPVRIGFQPQ